MWRLVGRSRGSWARIEGKGSMLVCRARIKKRERERFFIRIMGRLYIELQATEKCQLQSMNQWMEREWDSQIPSLYRGVELRIKKGATSTKKKTLFTM